MNNKIEMDNAKGIIVQNRVFTLMLCIPESWSDKEAKEFAEKEEPSGVGAGWRVAEDGSPMIQGAMSRVPCQEVLGRVHVVVHL